MSERKSFDERFAERIAERQARLGPPKEGTVFEHGPAKFLFAFLIGFVILTHLAILVVMMAGDVR